MTQEEFNEKYKDYLEEGHYGLDISYPSVVNYLDKLFMDLVKIPGFQYTQIKLKFNMARFYTNLYTVAPELSKIIDRTVEREIDFLVKVEDEVRERLNNKGE